MDSLKELLREISQPATMRAVDEKAAEVKAVAVPEPSQGAGEGKEGTVRFDEAYSVDQMLVDSLPTLEGEKVVQIGRRDVSRLLGN